MSDASPPYLQRLRANAVPFRCYYCGWTLSHRKWSGERGVTRDHILARAHGRIHQDVAINHRPACQECNGLRAELGHCCGALMLAVMEGATQKMTPLRAAMALGMIRQRSKHETRWARRIFRNRRQLMQIQSEESANV